MTLNGVMAVILRYFSEFGYFSGTLRKSSRSLSYLLMSSCYSPATFSVHHGMRQCARLDDKPISRYTFGGHALDVWATNHLRI